jgi:hypothetical protein
VIQSHTEDLNASWPGSRLKTIFASTCLLSFVAELAGTQFQLRAQNDRKPRSRAPAQVEEIYVARSVRESRIEPTEFCAKARTGFDNAIYEDRYTFRSIEIRSSDGLITEANAKTIGSGHTCFGRTDDPTLLSFYGEITLGHIAFKGSGGCRLLRPDFPEHGVTPNNCFLELSRLPDPYIGGLLTSNTVISLKTLGLESDPGGYTQSSIATVRLWKLRSQR